MKLRLAGYGNASMIVDAEPVTIGVVVGELAIHHSRGISGSQRDSWTISHIATGYSVVSNFHGTCEEAAHECAIKLMRVGEKAYRAAIENARPLEPMKEPA